MKRRLIRNVAEGMQVYNRMAPHTLRSPTSVLFSTGASAPVSEPENKPKIHVHSALGQGCMDYSKSWAWQHVLLSRRLALRRGLAADAVADDADCVLLLEHAPVYTLGRGADEENLTFLEPDTNCKIRPKLSRKARGPGTARLAVDRSSDTPQLLAMPLEEAIDQLSQLASPVLAPNHVPIYRVERGGEVTFHGPSQLVVYPLLDLKRAPFQQDLHWYLRMVEEIVIQTLEHYDIEGTRDETNTGVWVGEEKVAAVGISSSRWITTHGLALNVDPDLSYFDTSVILPCGIEGRGVTSMAKILTSRGESIPTLPEVAKVVTSVMEDILDANLVHR